MSLRVNVLTEGCRSPNGRAFLFPLLVYRRALRDAGIELKFKDKGGEEAVDCDVLIVESKYRGDLWRDDPQSLIGELAEYGKQVSRLLYFDIADSTGQVQADLLPIVTAYHKNQLLRDRGAYTKPMYGLRPYTDYYHTSFGIVDRQPSWSKPAPTDQLGKLKVGWNSGLADYSLHGPTRMAAYRHLRWRALLRFPTIQAEAERNRRFTVSCRFGSSYPRDTVSWQRRRISEIVAQQRQTRKVSRRRYFSELMNSQVIVSPFGFGEITLKDFETFLTGGLLYKPDMSHVETWPDLFRQGETIWSHNWSLDDFTANLEAILANPNHLTSIARAGQRNYQEYIGPAGERCFVEHFLSILNAK